MGCEVAVVKAELTVFVSCLLVSHKSMHMAAMMLVMLHLDVLVKTPHISVWHYVELSALITGGSCLQ